jgi:RHS repeat-associated protein
VDLESEYNPPQPSPTIAEPRTQFVYNEDRQLEEIVRPDGQTVDFEYGAADGRLASVGVGGDVRAYTYFGAAEPSSGQLKTLAGPDALLTFTYDGSLLLQESWDWNDLTSNSSVVRTYDDDLRITSLQVDSETPIAFGYDTDGMLTQAGSLTLTRDPDNGLLIATSLSSGGNAIDDSLGYSPFGEIATYAAEHDSSEVYSFAIDGRDKLGRITDRTETVTIVPAAPVSTTRHFEYDPAGRLWRVCEDETCASVLSEYLYDQNGNRTGGMIGGEAISATYDDQDRLLSYTRGSVNHTYTYSENGELESKTNTGTGAVTTYFYDAFGNLRSVTLPDETEIEYLIDGRNRRVGKKVNGSVEQRFAYKDQLNPAAELDADGEVVAQFVYGTKTNVPDYVIKGGSTYRIISDHLGSPLLVVNVSDGTIAQQIKYDEFGVVVSDTNSGFQPFGFAGGIYDPDTAFIRFGVRDYDSASGRWTTKDPVRFLGRNSNLYGYVVNNPINLTDRSGFDPSYVYYDVDSAGEAAIRYINPTSINENVEYAGSICVDSDGTYSYTPPQEGGKAQSRPSRCPEDLDEDGDYHTHADDDPAYDNENFSDADIANAKAKGHHSVLGTPSGTIKSFDGVSCVTVLGTGAK